MSTTSGNTSLICHPPSSVTSSTVNHTQPPAPVSTQNGDQPSTVDITRGVSGGMDGPAPARGGLGIELNSIYSGGLDPIRRPTKVPDLPKSP
ncbi:hypothetical protein N0V84_011144 [Fusarium piperis]|uniref:Uncharacterized protein n=1 Tax=Fusarium piperis TaxID=1435070 RepID=A0A9W8TE16_9HYPO|nr:hypothetical protein N0V84_011144 [Fusarium piperis]